MATTTTNQPQSNGTTQMGTKMIALCSAAIGIVYTAGYFATMPTPAHAAAPPAPDLSAVQPPAARAAMPPAAPTGARPNPSAPAPARKAGSGASAQGSLYRDGTYTGTGSNRIGSVEVAVTVQSDRITKVEITRCTTHYPERYIDNLPQQVLTRQSAQVDVVSGATKSTQDFRTAVEQALSQARI